MKQKLYFSVHFLSILLFIACGNIEHEQTIDLTETPERGSGLKRGKLLDIHQFKDRFNEYLSQMGTPYAIREFKQNKDSGFVSVNYRINANIFLTGKLRESSGATAEVTLVMGSDGSRNAAIEIIMMMSGLVKTTNPDLSATEVEQVLATIGMFDPQQDLSQLDTSLTINGVKYHALFMHDLGFLFTAIMKPD